MLNSSSIEDLGSYEDDWVFGFENRREKEYFCLRRGARDYDFESERVAEEAFRELGMVSTRHQYKGKQESSLIAYSAPCPTPPHGILMIIPP
jgi:hypothetical protein